MSKDGVVIRVNYSIDFQERLVSGYEKCDPPVDEKAATAVNDKLKARYAKLKAALALREHQEQNPAEPEDAPEIYVEAGVAALTTDSWKVGEEEEGPLEYYGEGNLENDLLASEITRLDGGGEGEPLVDLDSMTKTQLLDWALYHGHDLRNNARKAEILTQCKAIYLKVS